MPASTTGSVDDHRIQSAFHYERHKPEETDLYHIVEQYWSAFQAQLAEAGISLPSFVRNEFQSYLKCGLLQFGFVRVKCTGCRFEHLVAFSCKLRGICPSCGTRRMIETAAHLIDNVLPEVPVRQWVLTFPWPLRFLFARMPTALDRCLAVIIRAIETDLIHRAGLKRMSGAKSGAVTLIQRFGSALNLNVHAHILILDGVYTIDDAGYLHFHQVKAPTQAQLNTLLTRITWRIIRTLIKDGHLVEDAEQLRLDLPDTESLDDLHAVSIRYTVSMGPGRGNRTLTIRDPSLINHDHTAKALTSNQNGFSLNAAVACHSHQRDRLEHLCRYITRPAICLDRLAWRADGQVQVRLKSPFRDGTTHLLFSPLDFIARLVALIPTPGRNLVRYHGVFAPNARLRPHVVPARKKASRRRPANNTCATPSSDTTTEHENPAAPLTWAQRLKRVFELDVTRCPRCGGRLRVIADITDPAVIDRILTHIARAPPQIANRPVTINTLPAR